MRFVFSFLAVLISLTLVSRAAFPAAQFYTSGSNNHAHDDASSDGHSTVFLNGFLAHEHTHDHEERGSDHDDSTSTSEPRSNPSGHSHSHVHILVESAAWIATDSMFKTAVLIPPTASWSVVEDIYVFNFLSGIFRPPIA